MFRPCPFLAYPLLLGRAANPDSGFSGMWNDLVDTNALASL